MDSFHSRVRSKLLVDYIISRNLLTSFCRPAGTPFEGGDFQVQLDVQENYPHQAPKARFITKIFHPNIHFRTGEVRKIILIDEDTTIPLVENSV